MYQTKRSAKVALSNFCILRDLAISHPVMSHQVSQLYWQSCIVHPNFQFTRMTQYNQHLIPFSAVCSEQVHTFPMRSCLKMRKE